MPQQAIKLDGSTESYLSRLRNKSIAERYQSLWLLGDTQLLDQPLLGLVCSMRCPGQSSSERTTWRRRCVTPVYPSSGDFTRRWRRSASICCCVELNRSSSARPGHLKACGCPRPGDRESTPSECWLSRHSSGSFGVPQRPLPKNATASWVHWPQRLSFYTPTLEDESKAFVNSWLPMAVRSGHSICPGTL
jgi:hypothetical protein